MGSRKTLSQSRRKSRSLRRSTLNWRGARQSPLGLVLLLAVLVPSFLWLWTHWNYLSNFPGIISNYYARHFCSCVYVMQQSEEFCHDWTQQWIPIQSFEHQPERHEVVVVGLWQKATANWLGPETGCRLQ
ncbi:MAG: amidase [Bradymonadales bacterium]|nr:MAG: amidase [Bradymonadales bacterium]